jgi:hypothetical protein
MMKNFITEIGAWFIVLAITTTKTTKVNREFRMYPEAGPVSKAPDAPLP